MNNLCCGQFSRKQDGNNMEDWNGDDLREDFTPTDLSGDILRNLPLGERSDLEEQIYGTIYGHCAGDAIGLLTEFMEKESAKQYYGDHKELEYEHKVKDMHRSRWKDGDWTDDSDQMILIVDAIVESRGKVEAPDYAKRIIRWARHGFPELGDHAGMGLGATTAHVLRRHGFIDNPHEASKSVWITSDRVAAPNGAVMRTSPLGIYQYFDLAAVIKNTLTVCKVTHHDPRCQASSLAVTLAIAFMLRKHPSHWNANKGYDVEKIITDSFSVVKEFLLQDKLGQTHVQDLHDHMFAKSLKSLKLSGDNKIGYAFKAMGAGFWALRQTSFRDALQKITMEAGDADTNGAVAGALLGCKLGVTNLPSSWVDKFVHKDWLDKKLESFLSLMFEGNKEDSSPTDEVTDEVSAQDVNVATD